MDIKVTDKLKTNGICVISLRGDINTENVDDFKEKIDNIINSSIKKYIIDFQELNYLNSVGTSVIAFALKKTKKFQGDIKLINLSSSILELFEITRLAKVFDIYNSEDEAIKALSD